MCRGARAARGDLRRGTDMKKTLIRNYAKLIARVGASVQKGQHVLICAQAEAHAFVALLAEECYAAGAEKVTVEWESAQLLKLASRFEEVKELAAVPPWEEEKLRARAETPPVRIKLLSADPDGMKGADREKLTLAEMARSAITKPYTDAMTNRYQWCVAAVPSVGWAKKVFPEERANSAVEKLWELILKTSRADGKDPLTDWMWHNRALREKCDRLNALGLAALEYRSANGTSLRVGLIDGAKFIAGRKKTVSGDAFNPNIPTEECFTTPKRGEAEGIVYAVKPLSYGGELIENFWLRLRAAGSWSTARRRTRRCSAKFCPWTRARNTSANARSCPTIRPSTTRAYSFTTRCSTKTPAATSRWAEGIPIRSRGSRPCRRATLPRSASTIRPCTSTS